MCVCVWRGGGKRGGSQYWVVSSILYTYILTAAKYDEATAAKEEMEAKMKELKKIEQAKKSSERCGRAWGMGVGCGCQVGVLSGVLV